MKTFANIRSNLDGQVFVPEIATAGNLLAIFHDPNVFEIDIANDTEKPTILLERMSNDAQEVRR